MLRDDFARSARCRDTSCLEAAYRRSTRCNEGKCVEAAHRAGLVLVRSSQYVDDVLAVDEAGWSGLLVHVGRRQR